MPVPDFQAVMLPFLQLLSDGQEWKMRDVVESLAGHFSLTDEERQEMLPSGQSKVFSNRVGWAKTYLKNAGLVDNPTRGGLLPKKWSIWYESLKPRAEAKGLSDEQ